MNKQLQLFAAAAASVLTAAAQAAVLTVAPGALNLHPGETGGWGYTLLNDDSANYLLVTGAEFTLPPLSAFGSFDDLFQTRPDMVLLAPGATFAEAYGPASGIGHFTLAASAQGSLAGAVSLHYMLLSVSPNQPEFDPGLHVVTFDASASALTAVQAVPEPSTWAMFGIGALLALSRRRAFSSRSNA